jgi:hypothetical protein
MSEVTFFGEVTGLTSRAVDDSDDEEENSVSSLDVKVTFQPPDLPVGPHVRLFVSLVDHLPSDLEVICEITAETDSKFSGKVNRLSDGQLWLAAHFSSPLRADSWQTVALVDIVMQKLQPLISDAVILLVDREVKSLQKVCTSAAATGSDFGATKAPVPKTVSSPFEAALFEWCCVTGSAAQIILIPGSDVVTTIPSLLITSLKGM